MSGAILQVTIRGRVQGVGYRYWTAQRAIACGLEGWVRNRRDGSVEALFSGPAADVAEMIALCRTGPRSARVDDVTNEPGNADALKLRRPGERFSMLPTV
jgi:acylphosphatase